VTLECYVFIDIKSKFPDYITARKENQRISILYKNLLDKGRLIDDEANIMNKKILDIEKFINVQKINMKKENAQKSHIRRKNEGKTKEFFQLYGKLIKKLILITLLVHQEIQ
jgi:hypothetical protein